MFELHLFLNESINRTGEQPLYKQIYDAIRTGILSRKLQIGTKLPSTR
ncbi:MAG: GntR family transcriptional regulator, partial [Acidobacteria bacterium]|nr:GntR family transcriptional regulator [Acidobacteriota bacterium]